MVTHVARLGRAPRRVGLWVEVDEQLPSPEVLEPDGLAVLIGEREGRRGVARAECGHADTLARDGVSAGAQAFRLALQRPDGSEWSLTVRGEHMMGERPYGPRTDDGLLEAYVFERTVTKPTIGGLKSDLAGKPGVAFVAQFVGYFSLFARVTAESLGELQERIDGPYRTAGLRSDWSMNLTASAAAAPKRGSPDFCALVCARTNERSVRGAGGPGGQLPPARR